MPLIEFVTWTLKSSCAIHIKKNSGHRKLLHKLLLQADFVLSLCLGMTDSFIKVNILQGDLLLCVNTEGKMSK